MGREVYWEGIDPKPPHHLSNMAEAVLWQGHLWLPMKLCHWCLLMRQLLIEAAGWILKLYIEKSPITAMDNYTITRMLISSHSLLLPPSHLLFPLSCLSYPFLPFLYFVSGIQWSLYCMMSWMQKNKKDTTMNAFLKVATHKIHDIASYW